MIVLFLTGALVLLLGSLSGAALALTIVKMISDDNCIQMDDVEWEEEEE
jgi:hypothetical protein